VPVGPDPTRLLTAGHRDRHPDHHQDHRPPYQHPVFTTGQQVMAGRRRRGVVLGTLAVLVAASAAAGGWLATAGPPNGTPVPQGEGLTQVQAEAALRKAGLGARIRVVYDDDTGKGLVADSDPGEGRRVSPSSTVTLEISNGREHIPVPDLTGLTRPEAEAALKRVGLRLGKVRGEYEPDEPEGKVYRQDPGAEDDAHDSQPVEIRISLGARPVDLPDVEGRPLAEGRRILERSGFVVVVDRKKAYDNDSSPGEVASQSPAGDSKLAPGKTVTLVESLGPKVLKVPDVTGKTIGQAEAILRQKGFDTRTIGADVVDQVVSQRPAGGMMARLGDTITLITL
jgi:serine/threonine-protein kinase